MDRSTRTSQRWRPAIRPRAPALLTEIARRLRPPALLIAIALLGACGARSPGKATLYQWVDDSGAVRYTGDLRRIPRRQRDAAQPVVAGRSAERNAASLPGSRTTPIAAPTAEEWLGDEMPGDAPVSEKTAVLDAEARANELQALDARISELEIEIARDQEAIQVLITDPDTARELGRSPELDRIARRLPERQGQLAELRARREQLRNAGP
jgi:hypothetical protein